MKQTPAWMERLTFSSQPYLEAWVPQAMGRWTHLHQVLVAIAASVEQ